MNGDSVPNVVFTESGVVAPRTVGGSLSLSSRHDKIAVFHHSSNGFAELA